MSQQELYSKERLRKDLKGAETTEVYDTKTGKTVVKPATYWLVNRKFMMGFGLAILVYVVVYTWLLLGLMFYDEIPWVSSDMYQKAVFIAMVITPILGYVGGFLIEYGFRKKKITEDQGKSAGFWVGGPSIVIGVILTTTVIGWIIYLIIGSILSVIGFPDIYSMTTSTQAMYFGLNIGSPLLTLIGGVLLAKAIRGKDLRDIKD